MSDAVQSVLLGTLALDVALVAALILTMARGGIGADRTKLLAASRLVVLAVILQAAHFAEELATGFHRQFPELLGLSAWPDAIFVGLNLLWLTIWIVSIPGLRARWTPALVPLWFLGLASAANGVAHPAMALVTGGYFPGLATSLVSGVAGILLLRRLFVITARSALVA